MSERVVVTTRQRANHRAEHGGTGLRGGDFLRANLRTRGTGGPRRLHATPLTAPEQNIKKREIAGTANTYHISFSQNSSDPDTFYKLKELSRRLSNCDRRCDLMPRRDGHIALALLRYCTVYALDSCQCAHVRRSISGLHNGRISGPPTHVASLRQRLCSLRARHKREG